MIDSSFKITHRDTKYKKRSHFYKTLSVFSKIDIYEHTGGCPRGVMVKAMDCGIVEREFVLQSRYYVHFRANTLRKGMKPLILPAMG